MKKLKVILIVVVCILLCGIVSLSNNTDVLASEDMEISFDEKDNASKISLSTDSNIVYVDVHDLWNVVEGYVQIAGDDVEILEYGVTKNFEDIMEEKNGSDDSKVSIKFEEGVFIFSALYESEFEECINYTGHAFYIIVRGDLPITVELSNNKGTVEAIACHKMAANAEGHYLYGDVNQDFAVTANDALALLRHVVKLDLISKEEALNVADINHDNTISVEDALDILNVVVELKEHEILHTPNVDYFYGWQKIDPFKKVIY